ncbi:molecular chaperone [Yersinia mollaretii]|uniref:Molecular chaperone n=1 Tax=Yersinia mollaretii TaxID=33060 RepID=A0AA44CM70_YERMO|nr:molecular chaperone [Yersinia mollaretii]NIL23253.1 molecular chaperone [Yersinia mollaretii]CNJ36371.1 putative pilus chaperone%2C PapD family [Yersinia mollaretii]CNK84615.1 putative pilus chaperone%2C PapD family [Yersinia enterocolitica]CQQ89701.1 putative pilus chaperone%2C PapD family [Yersinia mollaretii]
MHMRKWLFVSNNVLLRWVNSGISTLLLLVMMASSTSAIASVIAERTRVIFSEGSTEESLQLVNSNKYPVAVQVWVDDGDLMATPEKAISPVLVLPPLFRLQPQAQRSLRLILSGANKLPVDRESAFWLNVYEIPPKSTTKVEDESFVTLGLRMQYKVFYRPKSIPAPGETLGKALTFTLARNGDSALIKVNNPTPYYASLASLTLGSAEALPDMVAPFSTLDFPLNHSPTAGNPTINFVLIDDLGNSKALSSNLK